MNGRKDIPVKAWKKEQTKLLAERYSLMDKYYQLKINIEMLPTAASAANLKKKLLRT